MPQPNSIEQFNQREEGSERRLEAYGRYKRQQFELFELDDLFPPCPNCGSRIGERVEFDFGICSETGYHDADEACSECI